MRGSLLTVSLFLEIAFSATSDGPPPATGQQFVGDQSVLAAPQLRPSGSPRNRHVLNAPNEQMMMPLVAPLFVEDGLLSSFITIVNASAANTNADVIALDRGIQVAKTTVFLDGHSQRVLKISDLLKISGTILSIGSVEIVPEPKAAASMSVLAQLSIQSTDSSGLVRFEEEFLMPTPMASNTFTASAPGLLGTPVVALMSTGMEEQTVTITCIQEREAKGDSVRQWQVAAGQMLLVPACNSTRNSFATVEDAANQDALHKRGAVGISVTTAGKPGDLSVFGFALSGEAGRLGYTALNFNDAGLRQSSNTVFTGIPVGHADLFPDATFRPEVAMVNFGSEPTTARVLYSRTDGSGPETSTVATLAVPPQTATSLRLPPLIGDSQMRNSFIVQSDAPAGSFAAQMIAAGGTEFGDIQLVGKDQKHAPNSGAHPWTILDGTASTLLLFNHSTKDQTFDVNITAGGVLWQQHYKLASLETKDLSINSLIESGTKDAHGTALPKSAREGEIGWSVPAGPNGTGRLLVSRPDVSLARNFSCDTQDVPCGLNLTTYSLDLLIDTGGTLGPASMQFCTTCWPNCSNCSGYFDYNGANTPVTWSSSDTSIAPVDENGNISGQGPGAASISAADYADGYCMAADGVANVASLSCTPNPVTRGSQLTCSIQGATGTGWQFSDGTNPAVKGPDGNSWSGTVVTSGKVSVTGKFTDGTSTSLSSTITVTSRAWQVSMPQAQKVANGSNSLPTLSSPPTTAEGSYGSSIFQFAFLSNASAVSSGPNQGYVYVTSLGTSGTQYIYELNPGIDNSSDDFAQHQYGNCGIPSLSDIVTAVTNHEAGLQNSHYAEIASQLASDNPGSFAEQSVAPPGTDPQNWLSQTIVPLIQQKFQAAKNAGDTEPPTNLPANINYPPYRSCP